MRTFNERTCEGEGEGAKDPQPYLVTPEQVADYMLTIEKLEPVMIPSPRRRKTVKPMFPRHAG